MQPDELNREVNRLYWETDAPVTRLAEQLQVSRGTFYNHIQPLPASGKCETCGGALEFRSRANRDAGDATCADCGHEQRIAPGGRAEPHAAPVHRRPRSPVDETDTSARGQTRESLLLAAQSAVTPGDDRSDRLRTQLLVVAIGAAVLGLGILYYSRRRS